MDLTKDQTLKIIYENRKIESLAVKYRFNTKTKWWCLACLTPIYVSYKQYGINSIFCDCCKSKFARHPTIVQYQYMRFLKEKQLKLIESNLDNINENLNNDKFNI